MPSIVHLYDLHRSETEKLVAALEWTERWGRQPITTGRVLIVVGNLLYAVGAFIADWSETHVLNPRWPPHAKFHNGQTMSLGVCLAAASFYFLFKPSILVRQIKDNMFSAAAIGSFYSFAALTAILYPGTDWKDPEAAFGGDQKYLFIGIVVAMWVGYSMEASRLTAYTKTKIRQY